MTPQTIVLTVTLRENGDYSTNIKSDVACDAKTLGVLLGAMRGCLHNMASETIALCHRSGGAAAADELMLGMAAGQNLEIQRGFSGGKIGIKTQPKQAQPGRLGEMAGGQ